MPEFLGVVALDLGTTYSGYAFSLISDFESDPLRIYSNVWHAESQQLLSKKTPTCLLLDAEKNTTAFGYDAENKYAELNEKGDYENYYYFHRFKMCLYQCENLDSALLEDITGKTLKAKVVFSKSIEALKFHCLESFKNKGSVIKPRDIRWVITLPTIWSDAAKQFMRKCAVKAGIPDDKLVIALEPEAASVYCQYQDPGKPKIWQKNDQKYIVVDLGGGTTDITVHETVSPVRGTDTHKFVREIVHANGSNCGATLVDEVFIALVTEIVGENLMKTLKDKYPAEYIDIIREFELVKRTDIESKEKVMYRPPLALINELLSKKGRGNLDDKVKASQYSGKIKVQRDKLSICTDLIISIFKDTVAKNIELVRGISQEDAVRGTETLILVGGFANCKLLVNAFKEEFPNMEIIVPIEAEMAVLKGAVLFGHRSVIKERRMRFSYGTEVFELFDPEQHEQSKSKKAAGRYICPKIFDVIVRKNELVPVDTEIVREYLTDRERENYMNLDLYTSNSKDPKYTDESGCRKACKAKITIPNPSIEQKTVKVKYTFGATEVRMVAVEKESGKTCEHSMKFI